MKSIRYLNGYVLIYKPEHPKAMKSKNWLGYVYEHIVVAEEEYKRSIGSDEEVHHLNFDRSDNTPENVIILPKKSHMKLHKWFDNGAMMSKDINGIGVNSKNPKLRCKVCDKPLNRKLMKYCSVTCDKIDRKSSMDVVTLQQIKQDFIELKTYVAVSKKYNLSDNGLRKWLRTRFGLSKETLSEALGKPGERAETT